MSFGKKLPVIAMVVLLAACGSPEKRAADYMAKAQQLYAAGDYAKARLEAQNALQVEPKNAKVRYLLAEIAEQQKLYQEMFEHLLVVVDVDPANVEARLKLGSLYFLGQSFDEAAKQTTELLKRAPKDTRVHLLQARVLIQKGNPKAGLAELTTALKLDPDNVDGILLQSAMDADENLEKGLATVDAAVKRLPKDKTRQLRELRIMMLAKDKRADAVEQGLLALSEDFPKEHGYQSQLAQFYTIQGRVNDADKLLKGLTEIDPANADTKLSYVQFLATQRDAEQAEAALKAFIEQSPDAGKLRLGLGEVYETSNRADAARKVYAALAERAPKSAEGLTARTRIVRMDILAGRRDDARAGIDRILFDFPNDPRGLQLRAALRFTEKKFDDAITDLRLLLGKEPNNDKALLLLAQTYLRKNDVVLARDTYKRLLEAIPDSPDALQQLAVLYAAGKKYAEAEALYRKSLEKQPDDLITWGRLVEILMAQGDTARAETEARRMAALANQAGVGDFSLGRVLVKKNDFNGAAEAFRKSVAARRNDPLALDGLVRSLLAAGKQDEAISALNQQLSGPNQLSARFLLGEIYGRAGDEGKASQYFEEVLKDRPDSVPTWESLAAIYKDRDARIAVYLRATTVLPASVELNMLLASEYVQAGRFDDAIRVYTALLETSPTHLPAINNLASLLLDQRSDMASYTRALDLAKALAKATMPAMQDTLGWAHYRVGQYAEAVKVLEPVVAEAGTDQLYRYHLGMAYLGAGNRVAAKQQLTKAVKRVKDEYPGLAEARTTLEKLN